MSRWSKSGLRVSERSPSGQRNAGSRPASCARPSCLCPCALTVSPWFPRGTPQGNARSGRTRTGGTTSHARERAGSYSERQQRPRGRTESRCRRLGGGLWQSPSTRRRAAHRMQGARGHCGSQHVATASHALLLRVCPGQAAWARPCVCNPLQGARRVTVALHAALPFCGATPVHSHKQEPLIHWTCTGTPRAF